VPACQEGPSLLGSIRIASGGLELYDKLEAEGRVAVQGILFDTNSDRIRPESTPTLNEIAAMLRQNASLSLVVEGHTDNVGNAGANQTLSEKRAAAVVAFLTGAGVEASRLESRSFGDGKPVATNDSPEGRQQNRRVELVKR
jgi:OmpA-OmpF porin, OOP family